MRCTTKQLLFGFGLIAACTMLITTLAYSSVSSQGNCKGSHPSRKDFYKSVRLLPPATVLEIVGNRLNYATVEEGIELGSFDLEPNFSVVPENFATKHDGCYGLTFCEKHLVILLIDELPPKMCPVVKS